MSHVALLLRALQYRHPDCNLSNVQEFRSLVLWLENTKIRAYRVEDRKGLADIQSTSWGAAFENWLAEVQCPFSSNTDSDTAVIAWLLQYAVSLVFQDNASTYNSQAGTDTKQEARKRKRQQEVYPDLASPQVQTALQQLAQKLQLPAEQGQSQSAILQAAYDLVTQQLLPAVEDTKLSQAAQQAAQQLAHLDANKFPLGFSTGDAELDTAATILRMLYIKDLRLLQSSIDEALVAVQEFTHNPKTDAALGRVGR